MASQLIGECVIFNVAFVGPARSGKSLFINRWHSLQTIGMIEAVDNVHQLRYAGGELMAPVGAASTSSGGGGGGGVRGADHSGEGTAAAHAARRRSSARRSSVFVSANQIQAVMALEKEQSSAAGGAGAGPLDDDAQFSRDGSLLSVLDSTSDTWPSDPASAKSRPFDDDHDHDHGAGFEAFPVATRRPTASGGGPASPVRGSDGRYVPTDYSRVVRSSVVLADCASAAVHRMFLYDTPGHVDRFSIPAALLSGRSIKVRLSGAVVCVDDDEMSRDPAAAAQVRALIDLCEKFGTAALVIYRGAPLPAEFRGRDDVRTMFVACAKDDFAQSSKAFSAFLSQLHAVELRSRQLDARRVDLQKEQIIEHVKRPRQLTPTTKRLWLESGHVDDGVATPLLVALIGASGSGKSTLLSALVDDFTLSHYEPTLRLETGTCRLVGDGGWARNLVLLEGPVHDVFAARPHIGIVLVDASSLGALAEAAACISEIENFHALPPCLCVCVTKQSLDDFVSLHDVGAWAGDLGAYLAGYVDVRERNGAFFPSLMASYLNDLEIEEQRIQRIVNLALVIPSASAASVSVMNVGDDAAHVASTAQMRRAYQRVPTTSGHNTRDVVVPAARSGAASSTATPTPVVAGASGTSPSKTSDAYQRVNRQQRTLSLLRQASASLPIHTISKSVEFERGDFQRSLRQMFDRRDAAASGFIEVAVAVQLLREFDPAEMFDLDRELRSVCSALPRSSNVHGFVNFDQFCAAVCRVTSRV